LLYKRSSVIRKIISKKWVLSLSVGIFLLPALVGRVCAEENKEESFEQRIESQDEQFIILLYELDIEVEKDWSYTMKLHTKEKILREDAKYLGEKPIYYDRGQEEIRNLKAFTVTPDGKQHRYAKIQDMKLYPGYPMYSDSMMKLITMREVNIGSVIDFQFTLAAKGGVIPKTFTYDAPLGTHTPLKEGIFKVTFPEELGIDYRGFNVEYVPEITKKDGKVTYYWQLTDIYDDSYESKEMFSPPPRVEDAENYLEFSSIKKWSDLSDWYYAVSEKNSKMNHTIEKKARELVSVCKTDKEKVRAIMEYIRDDFRYVSMSLEGHALEPHPIEEVYNNKYGDCKDLSLLCRAMLKVAGVRSYLVLYNGEYMITDPRFDLPLPSLFNHVILYVEDPVEGPYYIDVLLKGYDIGELPADMEAGYTFIINDTGGEFGRLPVLDEKMRSYRSETITDVNEDGTAIAKFKIFYDLDTSVDYRQGLKSLSEKQKNIFDTVFRESLGPGDELLDYGFENIDQDYGSISAHCKISYKNYYPITDGMIIINISGTDMSSLFNKDERKMPIFFPGNSLVETLDIIRIPKGFKVAHLPRDVSFDLDFFNFKRDYSYSREDNEIVLDQVSRYRRVELPKEDYGKLKKRYTSFAKDNSQRIILKKSKPWKEEIGDWFRGLRDK